MTKRVKKIIASLAFCMALGTCVGGVATSDLTVSAEGLTQADFKVLGASIRLKESQITNENSGESGIRFAVGVTTSAYETYAEEIKNNLHLLIMPKLLVDGALEKSETNGEAIAYDTAVSGEWEVSTQFSGYMQSFVYVKGIPTGCYDFELSARAYWEEDGTVKAYSDTIDRSFEWVADEALDSGLYPNSITVLESYLTQKTVTFAECVGVEPQAVKYGKTATKPETDPEKTEYYFTGWYVDETCETEYNFNSEIIANTTLYAGWKAWPTVLGNVLSDTYTYGGKAYDLVDLDYTQASVTLTDSEGYATQANVDANGNYTAKVKAGEYTIKVSYPNYYDGAKEIIVTDDGENTHDLTVSQRKVNGKWTSPLFNANTDWAVNTTDCSVTSISGDNKYSFFDGLIVPINADFVLSTELYYVAKGGSGTANAGFRFTKYGNHNSFFSLYMQNSDVVFCGNRVITDDIYTTTATNYANTNATNRIKLTVVKNDTNYYTFVNDNLVFVGQGDAFLAAQETGFLISPYVNGSQAVFANYFYSDNAELNQAIIEDVMATEKTIDGDLSDWDETNWTSEQASAVRASQVSATKNGESFKAMSYLGEDGVYLAIEHKHTTYKPYPATNNQWYNYTYVAFFLNGTNNATMKNSTNVNSVHQHRLLAGYTRGSVIAQIKTVSNDAEGYTTTIEVFVPWAICDNYSAYCEGDTLRMGFDCANAVRPNGGPDVLASQYYLTANGLTLIAPSSEA